MKAICVDDEVLDTLLVHQRRELGSACEMPRRVSTVAAAPQALLQSRDRRAQPHDHDLCPGDRPFETRELVARLDDARYQ